jgi:uncharacterized protein
MTRSTRVRIELTFHVANRIPPRYRRWSYAEGMTTALITGATAGLGAEYAWELARGGWNVVLVARDANRLESMARLLRDEAKVNAEVLRADLSVRKDVALVESRLADLDHPIDLLINNAGFGFETRFEKTDLKVLDASLDVMVRAVMVLSYAAAHAMRARGNGAILNVSSVAAEIPGGIYNAHKAWVKVFTEGLAADLKGSGVTATVVLPGLVHTEFHERAHVEIKGAPGWMWLMPRQVVRSSLRAVRRGRARFTPTLRYRILVRASHLVPRSFVNRLASRRRRP